MGRRKTPDPSVEQGGPTPYTDIQSEDILMGPNPKSTPPGGSISRVRVVPLHIETAKQFGGGAKGRTLALIYRQLCYWSKYAKWKGPNGKRFFYKSQKELSEELGYSEKTINRAIKALRELGLVVVEQLVLGGFWEVLGGSWVGLVVEVVGSAEAKGEWGR